MPVAQSPAHYINSSKGCSSITESFPLCFLLVLCAPVAALPVSEPHCAKEYKDNKGSAISCLYSIAGRTGGGQETAAYARDVSRTRHSHLASREMLNLH
jgi:hypothetical protein